MSKLLINEPPLQVLPSLATAIGLNEAIVVQQVHYWLSHYQKTKNAQHYRDGRWWVWNSYEQWKADNFPFWSTDTVQRALTSAEKQGVLLSARLSSDPRDRTKWYTIDYAALERLVDVTETDGVQDASPQVAVMEDSNLRSSTTASCGDVLYRDYTETTAEIAAHAAPALTEKKTGRGKRTSSPEETINAPSDDRRALFGEIVRAVLDCAPDDLRAKPFVTANRGRINRMVATMTQAGITVEQFRADYGPGGRWYALPVYLALDKANRPTVRPTLDLLQKTLGCLDNYQARQSGNGYARATPDVTPPPLYQPPPDTPPADFGALAEAMRRGLQEARRVR